MVENRGSTYTRTGFKKFASKTKRKLTRWGSAKQKAALKLAVAASAKARKMKATASRLTSNTNRLRIKRNLQKTAIKAKEVGKRAVRSVKKAAKTPNTTAMRVRRSIQKTGTKAKEAGKRTVRSARKAVKSATSGTNRMRLQQKAGKAVRSAKRKVGLKNKQTGSSANQGNLSNLKNLKGKRAKAAARLTSSTRNATKNKNTPARNAAGKARSLKANAATNVTRNATSNKNTPYSVRQANIMSAAEKRMAEMRRKRKNR